mgnify:CR=1 FL=1
MPRRLRDQTISYTRLQWVLAAALLLFAAGFYAFTFRPTQAETQRLETRLEMFRYELRTARARASDLPRIAAENDALTLRLAQSKRLPRHQELGEFVRDISRLGSQYSLRKFAYKYGLAKRSDTFSQLPIEIEFEGDLMNVYSFLRQTEELPRLSRLRSLSIKGAPARPGTVEVRMALNTYFSIDQ